MTMLHYQQQQRKTIWPCYTINSSNTKPHDQVTLSTAATQNHMTMLHYQQQQQHKTIRPCYTINSSNNTKPYNHVTLSTATTQNHMTMLYYQQQQHKTTWPCYTTNSSNTKPYDHVILSTAAATSGYKPYVSCPIFTSFVPNIFSLTDLNFLCQMDRAYTLNVKLVSCWVSITAVSTYICTLTFSFQRYIFSFSPVSSHLIAIQLTSQLSSPFLNFFLFQFY